MAMELSKPSDFGVPAVYWRIVACRFDFTADTVSMDLAGYVSQAARTTGQQPVASQTVVTAASIGDPRIAVYDWLKTQADWVGETDS